MEKYDCPDRKWVDRWSGVKRGLLKTKWKRVERRIPFKAETSVLSRGRVCTRACMRPPTRSRRAHAELEYMYNEDEAEDKGEGMWEDAPRNCRKGDELFTRRSCLPEICQSVFHLDEKIWLRAMKYWIMQRRGGLLGRHLVWKLCHAILWFWW